MFTGIIESLGTITGIRNRGLGSTLSLATEINLESSKIGDSICVSGACLTAVSIQGKSFEVDAAPETLALTTLGAARTGERVNIERALRLSDRLDGHLVSGHIDGQGEIVKRENKGNAIIIRVKVPASLSKYMIKKGSVAVDGISLTINNCGNDFFEVSIIPHTSKLTTIGFKKEGEKVNIETDLIGKYVEKFLLTGAKHGSSGSPEKGISMELLGKSGFL